MTESGLCEVRIPYEIMIIEFRILFISDYYENDSDYGITNLLLFNKEFNFNYATLNTTITSVEVSSVGLDTPK